MDRITCTLIIKKKHYRNSEKSPNPSIIKSLINYIIIKKKKKRFFGIHIVSPKCHLFYYNDRSTLSYQFNTQNISYKVFYFFSLFSIYVLIIFFFRMCLVIFNINVNNVYENMKLIDNFGMSPSPLSLMTMAAVSGEHNVRTRVTSR